MERVDALPSRRSNFFIGDGQYPSDGGKQLQLLWDSAGPWRELRGCPGRYSSPSRSLRRMRPKDLAESVGYLGSLQVFDLPGRDRIIIAWFKSGGALMTYEKRSAGAEDRSMFVHTLNTESGLLRKMDSLHISLAPPSVLASQASDENAEYTGALGRNERFNLALQVLPYLHDFEKNDSAFVLVRWLALLSSRKRQSAVERIIRQNLCSGMASSSLL